MNKIYFLLIFSLLTSCASLTENARNLRIATSLEEVRGCEKVGRVVSSSGLSNDAGMIMIGNNNSDVKHKNLAAEMGDTLYYVKNNSGLFGSERIGIVFKCSYRGLSSSF